MYSFIIESKNVRFVLQSPNENLLPHELEMLYKFVLQLEYEISDDDVEVLDITVCRAPTQIIKDVSDLVYSEAKNENHEYDNLYYEDSDAEDDL